MHDTAKGRAIQGLSQKRSVRAVVFDYGNVLCLEQTLEDMTGGYERYGARVRHSPGAILGTLLEATAALRPG